MHYFIHRTSESHWTIAKFDPDKTGMPIDTYDIHGNYCNCPSPKKPCKHQDMVHNWTDLGEPIGMYFDDQLDMFKSSPLNIPSMP